MLAFLNRTTSIQCNWRIAGTVGLAILAAIIGPSTGVAQEATESGSKKRAAEATAKEMPAEDEMAKPEKMRELTVDLAGDTWSFQVPESWQAKPPRVNFTKHDLRLSKVEGDPKKARMTFTISGGGTQANIDRWKSQFRLPVGDQAKDAVKTTTKKMDGYDISMVTINGTFMDSMGRGPFAGGKKVERPDYVMRAVIMAKEGATPMSPKCFVKLVGPKATMKQHAEAFDSMVKSMKVQAAPTPE